MLLLLLHRHAAVELATIREQLKTLHARLDAEKQRVDAITTAKRRLERLQLDLERANADADLERAARLLYGDIPATQKEIEKLSKEQQDAAAEESRAASATGGKLLSEVVGPEEVRQAFEGDGFKSARSVIIRGVTIRRRLCSAWFDCRWLMLCRGGRASLCRS